MSSNKELVEKLVNSGVLRTESIIRAFRKVDRKDFCLDEYKGLAYMDNPLPILAKQTISQPTTVAIMTEAIQPSKNNKVLEIGAGSGYQAAILSEIVKPGKVYTIERIKELADFAKRNLKKFDNVKVIHGDGSKGLEDKAPFDIIIITAASPEVPEVLKQQLNVDGKMIVPVGKNSFNQKMKLIKRNKDRFETIDLGEFLFVPLIGKYGFAE